MFGKSSKPAATQQPPATGPLRVLSSNKRYFTDGSGKTIYLTGVHEGKELQATEGLFPWTTYLDFMNTYNLNLIRMWVSEWFVYDPYGSPMYIAEPMPYVRSGPGNAVDGRPKFDLDKFDQSYFDKLRAWVIQARDRGIYIDYMMFNGIGDNTWPGHPFNAANNINNVNGDANRDGQGGDEIFTLTDPVITDIQERYVRKVIDKMNLAAMTPQPDLSSTGYLLASLGSEYLAYQPGSGSFTVTLVSGAYNVEWFNPATAQTSTGGAVNGQGSTTFTPPFSGQAVLYLKNTTITGSPTHPLNQLQQYLLYRPLCV